MCQPREWERGGGTVLALTPVLDTFLEAKAGRIDAATYKRFYLRDVAEYLRTLSEAQGEPATLAPGSLMASPIEGAELVPVKNGDTLCCGCSKAQAAAGQCHRVWAAELLAQNGWDVTLDGWELKPA